MDSEYEESVDHAQDEPDATAGAQLRAAREALRLDLPNIAAVTRIPLRHLEAIEGGDFGALPSRAYAIGFSRSFAKAVGLDPAAITDKVRAELTDGSMQRAASSSTMEPGDPARLPSAGLAWAGAVAALVLAIGTYAFYGAYFGAGTQPDTLIGAAPATAPASVPQSDPAATAPETGGEVVLTALADNVWLRLYEEGGDRLIERTLRQGETVTVPPAAADPRINTGRPDALGITVGGKAVAKLAERATTISGASVSAATLLGRAAPAPEVEMAANAAATGPAPAPLPTVPRSASSAAPRNALPTAARTPPDTVSGSSPELAVSSDNAQSTGN